MDEIVVTFGGGSGAAGGDAGGRKGEDRGIAGLQLDDGDDVGGAVVLGEVDLAVGGHTPETDLVAAA
jgi:hypothetical protein